jgi:enediyne biosynthesis protein E3
MRARVSSRLRLGVLGIAPEEASFERRGFRLGSAARPRLEEVGRTFVRGYRAALEDDDPGTIEQALAGVDCELRGFAYEGAAMGVTLRDMLSPWRSSRLDRLLAGPGSSHVYMVHVGAGWALARLRRPPRATLRLDPLLRWLALDGYGFHQGYFRPARHLRACVVPAAFTDYAARAFDQGLGRSLWFVEAAEPEAIAAAIHRFAPARQPDLWSGVGLAGAYAGGADASVLPRLADADAHAPGELAQGAAFAAAARQRAGNPAAHTDLACRMLCGLSSSEAAELTAHAARDLPPDSALPSYEVWRRRLRTALRRSAAEHAIDGRLA